MNRHSDTAGCLALAFGVTIQLLCATLSRSQQPLLQITSPASNSTAIEGTTVNITVSADPSVQNVGIVAQDPSRSHRRHLQLTN